MLSIFDFAISIWNEEETVSGAFADTSAATAATRSSVHEQVGKGKSKWACTGL